MTETPETDRLRRRQNRRTVIVVVMFAVLLFLSIKLPIDRANSARVAGSIVACRTRNSAQQLGREDSKAIIDGVLVFTHNSADGQRFVSGIHLASPAEMDRDCDGDGVLSSEDYEDAMPVAVATGDTIVLSKEG